MSISALHLVSFVKIFWPFTNMFLQRLSPKECQRLSISDLASHVTIGNIVKNSKSVNASIKHGFLHMYSLVAQVISNE